MIPDRISIHERPEADDTRFEDWEMGLIIGAQQKSAVLTIVERSKNMLLQTKLPSKRPEDVEKAVIRLLLPYKSISTQSQPTMAWSSATTRPYARLWTPQYISQIHIAPAKRELSRT